MAEKTLTKDEMIAALKKGDRIVTSGGIHGTVATVEDQSLMLKEADNTKIRISKSTVAVAWKWVRARSSSPISPPTGGASFW